jgi:hypothetical protein
METYTVIKKGSSVQHCLNIPPEFINKDLEITIKPIRSVGKIREKIESILKKNKNTKPFNSISDPVKWQKETRSDW